MLLLPLPVLVVPLVVRIRNEAHCDRIYKNACTRNTEFANLVRCSVQRDCTSRNA
jgi:hypothetical protein